MNVILRSDVSRFLTSKYRSGIHLAGIWIRLYGENALKTHWKCGKNIFLQFFFILLQTNTNDAHMQNFIQIPQKMKTGVPNEVKLVKLTLPFFKLFKGCDLWFSHCNITSWTLLSLLKISFAFSHRVLTWNILNS